MGHKRLHRDEHQKDGIDELNVQDLSGELADPQKPKEMHWLLRMGTYPEAYSNSTSYLVAGLIRFPGSNTMGKAPSSIKVIAGGDGDGMKVKIYDRTNSLMVAEKTDIPTDTDRGIYNLGDLSNIPVGEAVWEIQIASLSGMGTYANISEVTIEW